MSPSMSIELYLNLSASLYFHQIVVDASDLVLAYVTKNTLSDYSPALAAIQGKFYTRKMNWSAHSISISQIHTLHSTSTALPPSLSGTQLGNPLFWISNKITRFNRYEVITTVVSTDFTIALLPSMMVRQHDVSTVKVRHGEGPIVPPSWNNIGTTMLERGEKGPKRVV